MNLNAVVGNESSIQVSLSFFRQKPNTKHIKQIVYVILNYSVTMVFGVFCHTINVT